MKQLPAGLSNLLTKDETPKDTTFGVATKLNDLENEFKDSGLKGSLSVGSNFPPPEVIPTGIPELDNIVLSIGGLAVGRVVEIAGETNAGKSTLALNFCREAIKLGKTVVIAENEGTLTSDYLERIGLPPDSYHVFKGHKLNGSEYLDGILQLAEMGYDVIVIDSLFGIVGASESDARVTDSKMNTKQSGAQVVAVFARLWKNGWKPFLKKNKGKKIVKGTDSNTTLIVINHLKDKFDGFGKDVPGSKDMGFLYSQRIWLERLGMSKEDLDEDGNPVYTRVRLTCQKSKLSPGGRSAIMYVHNHSGIFYSDETVIVDLAVRRGLVSRSGGWITSKSEIFGTVGRWNGAHEFAEYCKANNEILSQVMSGD
jgi:RecA/RadA recombinase